MLGERILDQRDRDDRHAQAGQLTQQAGRERVRDTGRPPIHGVEGGRGHHDRIGSRESSGSSGIRNLARTRSPVSAANWAASMNRLPIGVAMTRTSQPASWASRANSSTPDAAGAPHTITYRTPGDLSRTLINRERSSPAFVQRESAARYTSRRAGKLVVHLLPTR
jgi:hypothetical protein